MLVCCTRDECCGPGSALPPYRTLVPLPSSWDLTPDLMPSVVGTVAGALLAHPLRLLVILGAALRGVPQVSAMGRLPHNTVL